MQFRFSRVCHQWSWKKFFLVSLLCSNCICMRAKLLQLCLTLCDLWTVAHQAPLTTEFSRKEYWSGLPFPSPGDLFDLGIEPGSPALQAESLPSEPPRSTCMVCRMSFVFQVVTSAGAKTQRWETGWRGLWQRWGYLREVQVLQGWSESWRRMDSPSQGGKWRLRGRIEENVDSPQNLLATYTVIEKVYQSW